MIDLIENDTGVLVRIVAQAGARRNEIRGEHAGALKISVTAAPEKGKANQAILQMLRDALGLAPSSVELVSGATSRRKQVRIRGVSGADLRQRLDLAMDGNKS